MLLSTFEPRSLVFVSSGSTSLGNIDRGSFSFPWGLVDVGDPSFLGPFRPDLSLFSRAVPWGPLSSETLSQFDAGDLGDLPFSCWQITPYPCRRHILQSDEVGCVSVS